MTACGPGPAHRRPGHARPGRAGARDMCVLGEATRDARARGTYDAVGVTVITVT